MSEKTTQLIQLHEAIEAFAQTHIKASGLDGDDITVNINIHNVDVADMPDGSIYVQGENSPYLRATIGNPYHGVCAVFFSRGIK